MRAAVADFVGSIPDRLMVRIPDLMLDRNRSSYEEYRERLELYCDGDHTEPFLRLGESAPEQRTLRTEAMDGGHLEVLSYPSRYEAWDPAMDAELRRHTANLTCYLHLWRHDPVGARPLVLCVHGYGMGDPQRAARMFKVKKLFGLGMDVALYTLPHHWRRSSDRRRQQILRPQDVPLTVETFAQNVHDLHAAQLLLRDRGYDRIGIVGASLGGLTAALYAAAGAPVDFIFMAVPAVDLTEQLRPRSSLFDFTVDEELVALSAKAVERMVPVHYRPTFDPDNISIVAHTGDQICKTKYTRQLVEAWSIPNYVEVTGGHWLYLDRSARGKAWYGWLDKHGYLR